MMYQIIISKFQEKCRKSRESSPFHSKFCDFLELHVMIISMDHSVTHTALHKTTKTMDITSVTPRLAKRFVCKDGKIHQQTAQMVSK